MDSARDIAHTRDYEMWPVCIRVSHGWSKAISSVASTVHLKTPLNNPPVDDPTEVEVTDPTPPLFGRRCALLSTRPRPHRVGDVVVAYRDTMVRRLPHVAPSLFDALPASAPRPKLTSHAVTELIAVAEQGAVLCPVTQPNAGIASRPRGKPVSAPTSRRSSRRCSLYSSALIPPQQLARQAVIYIRQSTPHQVVSQQESRRWPYALHERARQLGWPDEASAIMDDDLGLPAASAAHREGFTTLSAHVTLAQVGLILSYEVTRLSRNCSDWEPLLDLCGYKGCWIAAGDGIYDPATVNGRLLLGLQGTLSAWQRHTMKARLTAGLLHKAPRGALALTLPPGLVRNGQGKGLKLPNQEGQARLALVFEPCWPGRSARQVVDSFKRHALLLPRRDRCGDVVWKAPRVAAVLALLKHPAYASAFTYGRTRTVRREATQRRPSLPRLPQEAWRICMPNVYPAYISWETSLQMQAMLQDHHAEYDRNHPRGLPRPGTALVHGLVYCGEGGHKMGVQYQGGPRSICNYLRQQYRTPVCQYSAADPGDTRGATPFSRPARLWNSTSMRRQWPNGHSRPSA